MTIREASAVGVEPVVLTSESTVVGLYEPEETDRTGYQSDLTRDTLVGFR